LLITSNKPVVDFFTRFCAERAAFDQLNQPKISPNANKSVAGFILIPIKNFSGDGRPK